MSKTYLEIPTVVKQKCYLPTYATSGAAGADVRACITEEIVLAAGSSVLVPTGIKLAISEGYEVQVRPRSGLALHHQITVLNAPGTIDSDYRGEVCVVLINHGRKDYTVKPGDRIAQLVVAPVVQANFVAHEDLLVTARNTGGFGHSGMN